MMPAMARVQIESQKDPARMVPECSIINGVVQGADGEAEALGAIGEDVEGSSLLWAPPSLTVWKSWGGRSGERRRTGWAALLSDPADSSAT